MISMLAFAVLGVSYDLSPVLHNYALLDGDVVLSVPAVKPQVVVRPALPVVQQPAVQYYYTPQRVIRFGSSKMFSGSCASGSCR